MNTDGMELEQCATYLQMVVLLAKAHTSFFVCAYFGLEAAEDRKVRNKELATCRHCTRKISAKGRNTSNLFSHLRIHHPTEYNRQKHPLGTLLVVAWPLLLAAAPLSLQLQICWRLRTKYACNSKRWKELNWRSNFLHYKGHAAHVPLKNQGLSSCYQHLTCANSYLVATTSLELRYQLCVYAST